MTYLPHILAALASCAAALFAILWKLERDEADRLADELTKSAELDKAQRTKIEQWKAEADLFLNQKNNANTRAAQCEAETIRLLERIAYLERNATVRNAKGQYTRKPEAERSERSRKRERQKAARAAKVEAKPMTRAEACLAILNEAKDAGFVSAQSAIEQFDADYVNEEYISVRKSYDGFQAALIMAFGWLTSKEGYNYWDILSRTESVHNFKPVTQWPA